MLHSKWNRSSSSYSVRVLVAVALTMVGYVAKLTGLLGIVIQSIGCLFVHFGFVSILNERFEENFIL